MKKFEFPLARAAQWYRQNLASQQTVLQGILKDLAELEGRMQSLRQAKTLEQERVISSSVLLGGELRDLADYAELIRSKLEAARPLQTHLMARAEAQRKTVLECHRRVRLMENLETRRREEWLLELNKDQDALASDLFLAGLIRQQNEATTV
ncbi:MAG: hypothetical protein ABI824_07820 [Acidobacteriota bacterium]